MQRILSAILFVFLLWVVPAHAEEPIQVYLAGADWGVEIPGGGLQINPQATNIGETTARIVAADLTTGLNCSMDIVPAEMGSGNIGAQGAYISRNKKRMGMRDLDTNNEGQFAILEFMRKKIQGKKQNEKNILLCLAHQGSWVYVKLWKRDFQEADRPHFDRIIEGIRLVERQENDFDRADLIVRGMPTGETRQIFLPGASWGVEMPSYGFADDQLVSEETRNTLQLQALNSVNGCFISAFIEPAEGSGGSTEARTFCHERVKEATVEFSEEWTYEKGSLAILEYTWREVEGLELNQRHLHVYLAHQGSWVDLHLSKVSFTKADRPLFDRFVEGVRLVERQESEFTSAEFITLGIQAADQGKCDEADAHFQRALAINRVKTQMKKEQYVETLEALGICYGKSGQHEKALTTLREAVKMDAGNASLHYNLACAHAGLGDEAAAVVSLTAAYENLEARPYDLIPDPLADASFALMKENSDFKKIAKKISKRLQKSEKEMEKVFGKLERLAGE